MSKVILTVTRYNVDLKWENMENMMYGTKLNNTHLNAKAFGPHGEVNGTFNYFDQNKNKIKIGDILNAGHHSISAIFYPTDFLNYKSTKVITKNFVVLQKKKTIVKHISTQRNNSNIININVNTNY